MTTIFKRNGVELATDFWVGEGDDAIRYPYENLVVYTDAELAELGVTREVIPETPKPRQFSFLQFINLFTDAEQLAIVTAAMSVAAIKLWYDKAVGADWIDLDDPRTSAGINALVPAGLLTADRAAAVLASPAP